MTIALAIRRFLFLSVVVLSAACSEQRSDAEPATMNVQPRPDIVATNAFYYYRDVAAAHAFYRDTLGFETVVDYGFAKILRLAASSYLTVVQADAGMHSADEPKHVTLHLVTDEMNRWRDYLAERDIEIDDGDVAGDAASSFTILDVEGYRLRFVRHNPHPGHAGYVAAFAAATPVQSSIPRNGGMSVRATAFSVYYPDVDAVRPFFESLFEVTPGGSLDGVPVYALSSSGSVVLDAHEGPALPSPGRNGMTLSFFTSDVDAWFERASTWPGFSLRTEEVLDEGGLVRVFVGYDPAGIFLEWDTFPDVPENRLLTEYLD
jgi:catechol 2,3-dioxygenase-like lactoylglutathione lyase family enzyme